MSESLQPHGLLQARILEWVACSLLQGICPCSGDLPFSRGSSQPRDQTQVSRIADRFFTVRVTREAGVGSLPLLQRIFPAQESIWGLLNCRWILYQLSYQMFIKYFFLILFLNFT